MADTDQSLYNIRYNQITQGFEGFGGGSPMWTPLVSSGNGITQLTGIVTAGPGTGSQTTTLPLLSAHLLVGNASNLAAPVSLSGDATISNTGILTLASVNSDVGSFTSANITVDATGRITAAANGSGGSGGKILQVVSGQFSSTTSTTSLTYVSTGTTLSITPTNASNQILVFVNGLLGTASPVAANAIATIFRDSTDLASTSYGFMVTGGHMTERLFVSASYSFLDSPATTSPVTYTVYLRTDSTSEVVDWGVLGDQTMTLMEVAP